MALICLHIRHSKVSLTDASPLAIILYDGVAYRTVPRAAFARETKQAADSDVMVVFELQLRLLTSSHPRHSCTVVRQSVCAGSVKATASAITSDGSCAHLSDNCPYYAHRWQRQPAIPCWNVHTNGLTVTLSPWLNATNGRQFCE